MTWRSYSPDSWSTCHWHQTSNCYFCIQGVVQPSYLTEILQNTQLHYYFDPFLPWLYLYHFWGNLDVIFKITFLGCIQHLEQIAQSQGYRSSLLFLFFSCLNSLFLNFFSTLFFCRLYHTSHQCCTHQQHHAIHLMHSSAFFIWNMLHIDACANATLLT